MKKIKLTKGQFTIVDDDMFDYLNQWKWCYSMSRRGSCGYAIRNNYPETKKIYMHQVINNTPEGFETDHINRNKLDNRRANLRTATRMLNSRNQRERKDNTSGYKGISWDKETNSWAVYLSKSCKMIHLGRFKDLFEAINARKKGEELYWV